MYSVRQKLKLGAPAFPCRPGGLIAAGRAAGYSTSPMPPTWVAEEEPVRDYDPARNAYLPVAIGDIIGSGYKIVRKLGWGVYSTVWIAQALNDSRSTPAYVALKVMTRVATDAQDKLQELEFMRRIRDQSPRHPGYPHVIQLRDHFYHRGPHGRHLCLAMEVLLQDLRSFSLRFKGRVCPPYLVRLLARQVVLGLQYLHDECNIIHTDLKPGNIMMVPPGDPEAFLAMTIPKLEATLETSAELGPDGTTLPRVHSRPIPYPLPDFYDMYSFNTWTGVEVKIGDVGVACWADRTAHHFTDLIQTPPVRAPEVAIGAGWGKPADVWSLGCTLYELYMGKPLFGANTDEKSVPTLHTQMLGNYPPELIARGKRREEFFNSDGSLKRPPERRTPFDKAIRDRDVPDAALFADFLHHTFVLDPDGRATCRELLKHAWLNP